MACHRLINPWRLLSHSVPATRLPKLGGTVVMEKIRSANVRSCAAERRPVRLIAVSSSWREQLPVLRGAEVELRELRRSDAASLFAMITSDGVARFISPPPTTVEGFEAFIAWTHRQRAAGAYTCFAVTLKGYDTAIGLFQVRELEPGFATAEWGFAIGSAFWGTGVFKTERRPRSRIRLRDARRAPPGSARRYQKRARHRRSPEDRRRAGRAAAKVVSPQRRVSRSGALCHRVRRLAVRA